MDMNVGTTANTVGTTLSTLQFYFKFSELYYLLLYRHHLYCTLFNTPLYNMSQCYLRHHIVRCTAVFGTTPRLNL